MVKSLFNITGLQPVLDIISEMDNLWLKFIDHSGEKILTSHRKQPCNFCSLIRSSPEGATMCHASAQNILKTMDPCIKSSNHACHAGLIQVAVPIFFDGEPLGALICGEILESCPTQQQKYDISKLAAKLKLEPLELDRAYAEIPILGTGKVRLVGRLLETIVDFMMQIYNSRLKAEKLKVEKTLKVAELKALQLQINPHFLLNSLNIIYMLSLMEEANETQKLIRALSGLLKNNLQKGRSMVTLGEELAAVDDYLLIQRTRFGERLQIRKKVDPALLQVEVPLLILQPLVENAVVHGIEPKEEAGLLKITGWLEKNLVCFSIEDNGVGMDEQKLEEVQKYIVSAEGDNESMGLYNVHKRCQLLYGPAYGLQISSTLGEGTKVLLVLPAGLEMPVYDNGGDQETKLQVYNI